ncbi:hypothetical protein AGMMS49579_03660 [Spirochaetia bacterium]|nr:hypothetical protein AGMMS49579_03660 [Spirochaetia bacterium]
MERKIFFTVLVILATALPCMGQAVSDSSVRDSSETVIVYRLPDPERLYIYRNGTVVYDAKIPGSAIINNSFVLPLNIQTDSFTIVQSGKRIYSYTTEITEELVALRRGERPSLVRVFQVTVPDIQPNVPLEVKYGIRNSGIYWDMRIDLELQENNALECSLLAVINTESELPDITQSILAKQPEIILAASQNTIIENSGVMFNLGTPLIEANKRIQMKLEDGKVPYNIVYAWDANDEERPDAYIRFANPFKTMANSIKTYLNSSGMNISTSSASISPDRNFNLYVGQQPNIRTFKSVTTAEFPERENLPFTHSLEYSVENLLNQNIDIEISAPVTYGVKHRTQYHFTKEPDARPGDRMVWKFNVAPGGKAAVNFSFDAETKDDPLYRQFDYSSGGR